MSKKERKKEKKEEERKRRDSDSKRWKAAEPNTATMNGKWKRASKESNGDKGSGMLWRKRGKEKRDQDSGSRGNESEDGEEDLSSDYSEEVKKVSLKDGDDILPPHLEVNFRSCLSPFLPCADVWPTQVYAGPSLLKYEETAEHYQTWANAVEMFPDGSVHYPDMNSLVLSTPKADREI